MHVDGYMIRCALCGRVCNERDGRPKPHAVLGVSRTVRCLGHVSKGAPVSLLVAVLDELPGTCEAVANKLGPAISIVFAALKVLDASGLAVCAQEELRVGQRVRMWRASSGAALIEPGAA